LRIIELSDLRSVLVYSDAIASMREALISNSRGICETPLPMHLEIAAELGEVHMKSSYRHGGRYFALKVACTFPGNRARGLSTGNGMTLLCSAETGEPLALLADAGHLTDVRTAAAAAMVANELERNDTAIGILGTGVQARLQARMHAEVLDLEQVWIWGRSPERAARCCADLRTLLPQTEILAASSPAEVARQCRLLITATASRKPLLSARDIQPGTHISAVGADAPGKQELDPGILCRAALLLVDSPRQCEMLGEFQHAPGEWRRALEIGAFCDQHPSWDRDGITVCDFTGLGVEDLYIAEYCYEKLGVRSLDENSSV
jgi:ornithine cyclodeaminase